MVAACASRVLVSSRSRCGAVGFVLASMLVARGAVCAPALVLRRAVEEACARAMHLLAIVRGVYVV